jgi:hypothetical protein
MKKIFLILGSYFLASTLGYFYLGNSFISGYLTCLGASFVITLLDVVLTKSNL